MADRLHHADFETQGFTILRNLVDMDRVIALRERVRTVFRQAIENLPEALGRPENDASLEACYLFLKEKAPMTCLVSWTGSSTPLRTRAWSTSARNDTVHR